MNKRATTIEITLQSDLCAGSGYSYAGVIDSDVESDQYGFPFIPARRLKGCLREAAELIRVILRTENDPERDKEVIQELFGERGKDAPGGLFIENARIENYTALVEEAGRTSFVVDYSKENVLQQFTSVRAQTRIDREGIVMDNTLRFTRVVNRISPLTQKALRFTAPVTYPAEYEEDLRQIVRATKHIGMDRNRGLGNVCCKLVLPSQVKDDSPIKEAGNGTEVWEIRYEIANQSPLMISQGSDNVSESYIPGRMVLGALATRYLDCKSAGSKNKEARNKAADDKEFRELFLNGKTTQFLNAYIAENHDPDHPDRVERCIPVPGYINRLKKSKNLVNYELVHKAPDQDKVQNNSQNKDLRVDAEDLAAYGVKGGNQPKKLSGKYCTISDEAKPAIRIRETDRQLTYHHGNRGKDNAQLYSHLEIAGGQRFIGVIRTTAAYKDLVVSLLEMDDHVLWIGKSRSAQYGKCSVRNITAARLENKPLTIDENQGDETILVSFSAPAVFTDDEGREIVDYKNVYKLVAKELGIADSVGAAYCDPDRQNPGNKDDVSLDPFGIIDTKLIYGYQSVWNLRRTPVPAIAEGSVLAYRVQSGSTIERTQMVGERQLEGCGEIHVETMSRLDYRLEDGDKKDQEGLVVGKRDDGTDHPSKSDHYDYLKPLVTRMEIAGKLPKALEAKREDAVQSVLSKLSASELGRVTLMLRESRDAVTMIPQSNTELREVTELLMEARRNAAPWDVQFVDFVKRIETIKTKGTRNKALDYAGKCDPSHLDKDMQDLWWRIAMEGLTCQKYRKKLEPSGTEE